MKHVDNTILYNGKWLSLKQTAYTNKNGKEVKWESIQRTNTTKTVVIIPKLIPSNTYIFIKQYRPAINNFVIGFPAGLVENDDLEKEAIRELSEETGYHGKVKKISPTLYSNPALLTDTVNLVSVEIDEKMEENKNPVQCLEEEEEIEVIRVKRNDVVNFLRQEQKIGTAIGIGPWYVFGNTVC